MLDAAIGPRFEASSLRIRRVFSAAGTLEASFVGGFVDGMDAAFAAPGAAGLAGLFMMAELGIFLFTSMRCPASDT
jgi:hypothetical protein